jgi:hypothetical protein
MAREGNTEDQGGGQLADAEEREHKSTLDSAPLRYVICSLGAASCFTSPLKVDRVGFSFDPHEARAPATQIPIKRPVDT